MRLLSFTEVINLCNAHSALQVPTGLQIVDKVFQFTSWP